MAARKSKEDFQFIVSNGPQTSDDPEVRTIIRKQAMKGVAIARRKRGDYGRFDAMQDPVLDRNTSGPKGTIGHRLDVSGESANPVSRANTGPTSVIKARSATAVTASMGVIRFPTPSDSQSHQWLRSLASQVSLRHHGSLPPNKFRHQPEHHFGNFTGLQSSRHAPWQADELIPEFCTEPLWPQAIPDCCR
jgi:hypothetical protein